MINRDREKAIQKENMPRRGKTTAMPHFKGARPRGEKPVASAKFIVFDAGQALMPYFSVAAIKHKKISRQQENKTQ